ncbi:MAG: response regulator [Planctomycetales bacterium]|nr:response regulator [Planctomycetales bacterium]
MAKKTVLDVGNCVPDHSSIKAMLTTQFDVDVLQSHAAEDTLSLLRQQAVDLVLINRKLDRDYSDGTEILRQIKADSKLKPIPVMLVTNYAEHQEAAVALGAEYGFGKLELQTDQTRQKLASLLA